MTKMSPDDQCKFCQQTRQWHDDNNPKHPFNDGTLPHSAAFGVRRSDGSRGPAPSRGNVPPPAWPFDPVLRQALIDKGLLTPEDLTVAENKIRAVTAQIIPEVKGHG